MKGNIFRFIPNKCHMTQSQGAQLHKNYGDKTVNYPENTRAERITVGALVSSHTYTCSHISYLQHPPAPPVSAEQLLMHKVWENLVIFSWNPHSEEKFW